MNFAKFWVYLPQTIVFSALLSFNSLNNNAEASTLYVGSFNNSSVLRFNGETGAFIDEFIPSGSGGLTAPVAITFSPEDNNFYPISFFTNNILRYEQGTGNFLNEFIPQSSGNIIFPQDLTFADNGKLYVTNTGNDTINIYDAQTGNFEGNLFTADESVCHAPFAVRVGADNNLYFSCTFSNIIRRHNLTTNQTETLGTASSENAAPGGLGFDSDGNLYVSTNPSQKVGQFVPGFVSRYDGQTGAFIDQFIPEGTGGLDGAGWLVFTEENITVPESSSSLAILGLGVGMLTVSAFKRR